MYNFRKLIVVCISVKFWMRRVKRYNRRVRCEYSLFFSNYFDSKIEIRLQNSCFRAFKRLVDGSDLVKEEL